MTGEEHPRNLKYNLGMDCAVKTNLAVHEDSQQQSYHSNFAIYLEAAEESYFT